MKDRRLSGKKISPQLLREARIRQRDGEWLSSAREPVLRKYRGKYVAIRNKKILVASATMKGLYSRLDRLNAGMVLIMRIEKPALLVYVSHVFTN